MRGVPARHASLHGTDGSYTVYQQLRARPMGLWVAIAYFVCFMQAGVVAAVLNVWTACIRKLCRTAYNAAALGGLSG